MKCGLIEMHYMAILFFPLCTINSENIQHPIQILHFQFIIQCKQHSLNEVIMLVMGSGNIHLLYHFLKIIIM